MKLAFQFLGVVICFGIIYTGGFYLIVRDNNNEHFNLIFTSIFIPILGFILCILCFEDGRTPAEKKVRRLSSSIMNYENIIADLIGKEKTYKGKDPIDKIKLLKKNILNFAGGGISEITLLRNYVSSIIENKKNKSNTNFLIAFIMGATALLARENLVIFLTSDSIINISEATLKNFSNVFILLIGFFSIVLILRERFRNLEILLLIESLSQQCIDELEMVNKYNNSEDTRFEYFKKRK